MRVLALKSYREFRNAIPTEFTATIGKDRGPRVADFREIVGEQARLYRREQMPRAGNEELRHKRWAKWLAEVQFDNASWEEVESIDDDTISDLKDKQPAIKFYIAVYYRLHACLENPQYADRIDRVVFGDVLRENGNPVFIAAPDGPKRLHATLPRDIRLDHTYQSGRPEFAATKQALLNNITAPSSSVVAIHGPGGYGKTALVEELCLDEELRQAFPGGIYWLQFGMLYDRNGLKRDGFIREQEAIDQMLRSQYEATEISARGVDSVRKLLSNLPDSRLLVVADDIWNTSQSDWLNELPEQVTVLFTTRHVALTRGCSRIIPVTRLDPAASYRLLSDGMSEITVDMEARLLAVCEGFKGWPLIIRLANGRFKRDHGRSSLEGILKEYEQFLRDRSIRGWDIEGTEDDRTAKRRTLVGCCIQAGLDALVSERERVALASLAVFPEDTEIPVTVISDFWKELLTWEPVSNGFSAIQANALLAEFDDLSFFRKYTGIDGGIQLHDEVLAYLRTLHTSPQNQQLHQRMVQALQRHCKSNEWHRLPAHHTYGWKHLLYHLEMGEQIDLANQLLVDFRWIKSKLSAVGHTAVQAGFSSEIVNQSAQSVGRAIALSVRVLESRPEALALQLFGRLGQETDGPIQDMLSVVRTSPEFWPRPVEPHLPPLGIELLRLVGHKAEVRSALFDQSGQRILTASEDGSAQLWDSSTGLRIGPPLRHDGPVNSAVFDLEGLRVLSSSDDKTARLWDAATGSQIGPSLYHRDKVVGAAFSPDGTLVLTASEDKTARLWIAATGQPFQKPLRHDCGVRIAIFHPGGEKVLTVSEANDVSLWRISSRRRIWSDDYVYDVSDAAFSKSGNWVLIASVRYGGLILNSQTGELVGRGPFDDEPVSRAVFDYGCERVLTASPDGIARLWDASTGEQIGREFSHKGCVTSAVFDPEEKRVLTASSDHTARLWDTVTGEKIGPALLHDGPLLGAVFDPSGKRILTASRDRTARLWDAEGAAMLGPDHKSDITVSDFRSGEPKHTTSRDMPTWSWDASTVPLVGLATQHSDAVEKVAFDPKNDRVLTTSRDNTAKVWNLTNGAQIGQINCHDGDLTTAEFDLRGSRVLTVSDRSFSLWGADTGKAIGVGLGSGGAIKSAEFDSLGRTVLVVSDDETARLWEAETGKPIESPISRYNDVTDAMFDPSGRLILTTSKDRTFQLWDAIAGVKIGEAIYHDESISSAQFDPSGRIIATICNDGMARLWCVQSGAQLGSTLGSNNPILYIEFDPSGSRFLTYSADRTFSLWNSATGKPICAAQRCGSGFSVLFDQSGRKMLTGSYDGAACLWDTTTGAKIEATVPYIHWFSSCPPPVFDPSGRWILASSIDQTFRFWDISAQDCTIVVDFDSAVTAFAYKSSSLVVGLASGQVCFFSL